MTITIRTRNATWDVTATSTDRILYAGLNAALPLPYECGSGTCGTCKARVKTGTITDLWPQAPGRAGLKADKGEFLMCQCAADGDVEILVPGNLPETLDGHVPMHYTGALTVTSRLVRDVAEFSIQLSQPVNFDPGQFVVVRLPGLDGYRAYSMTNFARDTRHLEFVIKEKPDGGFSRWLFSDAARESTVDVFGPLGQATFRPDEKKGILCIAGGSGIAGMMAILQAATADDYFANASVPGHVFFGVRTMNDLFFAQELREFVASANGHLKVTIALSDEPVENTHSDEPRTDPLSYANGFVHEVAAEQMAGLFDNTIAYVAGPPPMVDGALRMLITEAKLSPDRIRYDKFN